MATTSSKIVHIHDKAFRNAMSDLRVARDFLSHYLPKAILNKINLTTLSLCKESFVDDEFKLWVTDVLYSVDAQEINEKEKTQPTFIYLLCEHLSTPDRLAPWRMLRYVSRIVDHQLKIITDSKLPLVIPIVIYNGRVTYPYSTQLYDLFDDSDKVLAKQYMFQGFELVDFNSVSDEEMRQHRWSSIMEILLKHAHSRDIISCLESLTSHIRILANEQADSYLLGMLKYVVEFTPIDDKKRFTDFLQKSLPPPLEERAMTTLAQLWREEGLQQGIQQGMQRGMQQGMQRGEYAALMRLLEQKFNIVPEAYRQQLRNADAETLLHWIGRVLEAETLAEVFISDAVK